ncbi:MAG: hypothetical protein CFK52_04435 [Chloracidobacterium sp. CP2_5A]|nr:MAG: hypothetical protein CFK52_04435 [Chloracidobacterium sp. CP2_5A]
MTFLPSGATLPQVQPGLVSGFAPAPGISGGAEWLRRAEQAQKNHLRRFLKLTELGAEPLKRGRQRSSGAVPLARLQARGERSFEETPSRAAFRRASRFAKRGQAAMTASPLSFRGRFGVLRHRFQAR